MTADCDYSQHGLVSNHAYGVIGVNYDTNRIIMRNPWGFEEYTGPGSDQASDGQFEVPVDIFKSSFGGFTILMYDDWNWTVLGRDTITYDGDMYYNIYNDREQQVIVTFEVP